MRDKKLLQASATDQVDWRRWSFTSVRLPLHSFTTVWIIRNPLFFFSRCHFLDPSEGFCPATCCGDWGLRGLTEINAEGLATEDPGSHYLGCKNTLRSTWRLFQSIRTCRYSTTTGYVTRRRYVTVLATLWTLQVGCNSSYHHTTSYLTVSKASMLLIWQ